MAFVLTIPIRSGQMKSVDYYLDLFRQHGCEAIHHEIEWAQTNAMFEEAIALVFHFNDEIDLLTAQLIL